MPGAGRRLLQLASGPADLLADRPWISACGFAALLGLAGWLALILQDTREALRDVERQLFLETPIIASRTAVEHARLESALLRFRVAMSEAARRDVSRRLDVLYTRALVWPGAVSTPFMQDFFSSHPHHADPDGRMRALVEAIDAVMENPTPATLDAAAQKVAAGARDFFEMHAEWTSNMRVGLHDEYQRSRELQRRAIAVAGALIAATVVLGASVMVQTRRALANRRRYELALAGAADAIADYDLERDRIHTTPRFAAMAGLAKSPRTVDDMMALIDPADHDVLSAAFRACVMEGRPLDVSVRLRHAQGREVWVRARAGAVREDGRTLRVVGVISDITESVLAERRAERTERAAQELENSLRVEKEVNGLQRQFVSMVSHEFRTPLTVIDGKARQLLRKGQSLHPADYAERLTVVRRSVSRLIDLIESVLASSRLEEGKIAATVQEVDVGALVLEVAQTGRDLFPEHRVTTEIAPKIDPMLLDPTLMRQVLSNLMSNAGKYSDPGDSVTLRVGLEDAGATLRISVADSGVGIPAAELTKLFQRFFRASTAKGRPGTGIGLHLINHFVALHDGRMDVESVEGQGSTFHVILPVRRAARGDLDAAAA